MNSWSVAVEAGKEGLVGREGGQTDEFLVGMRVLAVDGDLTCLKVLEALLLRCRYHAGTTNQATVTIKLLRECSDKFDLVISDVHVLDMDGFKILEIVGLEMDLPVTMLSANSEIKTVMKGITHGPCDYLLKPVGIEELRNIWQHVFSRKKLHHRDYSKFDNWEESQKHQNELFGGKRKDQKEEEDDDSEENMHEDEDPTTRVVWSINRHQKFVAADNQLGIDEAVPKRILELIIVEKLTRENVVSHLQKKEIDCCHRILSDNDKLANNGLKRNIFLARKYRLFLKRLQCCGKPTG